MFDGETKRRVFRLTQSKAPSVQTASDVVWHSTAGRKATRRKARKDMEGDGEAWKEVDGFWAGQCPQP
jgi:hypothetical protein